MLLSCRTGGLQRFRNPRWGGALVVRWGTNIAGGENYGVPRPPGIGYPPSRQSRKCGRPQVATRILSTGVRACPASIFISHGALRGAKKKKGEGSPENWRNVTPAGMPGRSWISSAAASGVSAATCPFESEVGIAFEDASSARSAAARSEEAPPLAEASMVTCFRVYQ